MPQRLKAALWRIVYVVIVVIVLMLIGPLFLELIGVTIPGTMLALLKACLGLIALIYVVFGPDAPAPL